MLITVQLAPTQRRWDGRLDELGRGPDAMGRDDASVRVCEARLFGYQASA